ncbi:uncharacterized protein PV09_08221 [Verruconis gallopava]|uniref:Acyltransferase 3 domain-containing protein n=1 Tax=Verruconis gallopava TaxID=253628 RepID=A0A0D2A1H2_9PEZI|nr:uncharacterized protein PV09_08221 [Verruconis gallopava]KIW00180.1 hypothetical protein PV09_08221 [Verruconis gallopava]
MSGENARLYNDDDAVIHEQRVSSSSENEISEWARDREAQAGFHHSQASLPVSILLAQLFLSIWAALIHYLSWKRIRQVLRPSFLSGSDGEHEKSRGGANGALDGLRGVSCLIVALYHFFGEFYELDKGYIWDWDSPNGGPLATWLNLPIVKAFYNGPNMVAIFFMISGYVLSHRFIELIRRGQIDKALGSMPSAIFRRWMRLFFPVGVSFAITGFLVWCGIYEYSRTQHDGYAESMGHLPGPFPKRGENAWDQMSIWLQTWRHLFHSFTWERYGPVDIDSDAWTISVEYRSSIVVFMSVIALARVRRLILRLSLIVLIMAWAIQWEPRAWEVVLFLGGTFVAEINVANRLSMELGCDATEKHRSHLRMSSHWWMVVMVVMMYLISVPSLHLYDSDPGWGWHLLRDIGKIPSSYLFNMYQFLGALLLILATTNWEPLQHLLNMPVPQYLGRLSYSLYLVHGPWVKLCGWALVPRFLNIVYGRLGSLDRDFNASACLGFLIFMPTTIYFADIFMRYVDIPSVKMSRQIWDFCTS